MGAHLRLLDSPRRDRLLDRGERTLSALTTSALVKTYGDTQALAGIDLDVPLGSVYGLVGPNGSGKTTILEIIAGLRHPTAGTINLSVAREDVAYCPDAADFEPWLTALEVLDIAAGLLGRPRPRAELSDILDRVGLADSASRRVGGFSRGMRTRLGLGAGLVGAPRLLVADEPAAALDPAGKVEMIDLLAEIAGPVTVLVSSHDLADVEKICSHIGVLVQGRLAYQGTLAHLLEGTTPAIRLVVRPPANDLVALLNDEWWATSVTEGKPGELMINLDGEDAAEAAERRLAPLLSTAGANLVELGRGGIRLQDIFFELTTTGPRRPAEVHSS